MPSISAIGLDSGAETTDHQSFKFLPQSGKNH
jgi:hypothetical protein